MIFGTQFKQGDILIIPFPFSDLSTVKQRPVLVISNEKYNINTKDIIVCGITSNLKDTIYSILIENKNLVEGNIPTVSRVKVDKIITLDKSLIKKRIGKLNNKIFEKVKSEISKLF